MAKQAKTVEKVAATESTETHEVQSSTLKSKRFVLRKSLIGKNQMIEFTNPKGESFTYNHDKAFTIMEGKLAEMPCWDKYKTYTCTNNLPVILRDKELV